MFPRLEPDLIRVNATSPGVIDGDASNALGEQGRIGSFADITARNPASGTAHRQNAISHGAERDLDLDLDRALPDQRA
ncbi:hypothetical protein [Streptomyces sp. NPDC005046]